jgi:hypothetical protein
MKKNLPLILAGLICMITPIFGQVTTDTAICKSNFTYKIDHSIMSLLPSLAVQFDNTSFPDSAKYQWDFGDGNVSNERNPFHIYNLLPKNPVQSSLISEFTACLTIYTPSGCSSTFCNTVYDKKDTLPNACKVSFVYYKNDSGVSIPELIPYVFLGQSDAKVMKWSWDFGDGQKSNEQNPKHSFNFMDTSSYVCLTIETADGCINSYCQMVYINIATCPANFTYTMSKSIPPIFNFFDKSEGNINKWYWDFGDGTSSYEKNPTHVFSNQPSYTSDSLGYRQAIYKVCHTVSTFYGGSCTKCTEINVPIYDSLPFPDCNYHILLNYSQILGNSNCQGSATAILVDNAGNKHQGVKYQWSNGSSNNSTSGLCSNFPYYVIISDEKGCETAASFALMDYSSPVPYFGLWQYQKNGSNYHFGSTTDNGNLQYVWEFDNGDSIVGNSVDYNLNDGATQKVVLKVKDSAGNILYTENIYLNQLDVLNNTNPIEQNEGNLHYYPNPVNHTLYIDITGLTSDSKINADVFDATGKLILSNQYIASGPQSNLKIDVSGLSKGMYIVKLISASKTIGSIRFIK